MTRNKLPATKVRIDGLPPEEYAAQWGCDGAGDRAPNKLGDGAFFYNFGSEIQKRTPEWLTGFLGAIDRTIQSVTQRPENFESEDLANITKLREYVAGLIPTGERPDWYGLDEFTRAYVEALLWAETDDDGEPFDSNYSHADIDTATLVKIVADCSKFQQDNAADLSLAYGLYQRNDWAPEAQAGHDFALTRNHHGVGFWDRGIGEVGKRLTEASHKAGEVNLYVGDDGKLHL